MEHFCANMAYSLKKSLKYLKMNSVEFNIDFEVEAEWKIRMFFLSIP